MLNEGELFLATRYIHVYWVNSKKTIICQAITDYIPHQEFELIFLDLLEYIFDNPTDMFVFDKSSLVTFHQDTLRFFYFDWKQKVEELGIKKFKHILPNNKSFITSLKTTKDILRKERPDVCIDVPCIEYISNLDDAFER